MMPVNINSQSLETRQKLLAKTVILVRVSWNSYDLQESFQIKSVKSCQISNPELSQLRVMHL